VLVVDNSIDGNAVWLKSDPQIGPHVEYLHVKLGGLTSARNAALDYTRNLEAALAFIDDDEVPHQNWVRTAQSVNDFSNNEILAGPVIPDFVNKEQDPKIVIKYWGRPVRGDRDLVDGFVGDGNIVYPSKLVLSGLKYSQEFSFTGGQDTDFLMRAKKMGYKIRNLNELAVTERVPPVRQNFSYLVDRSFHSSISWVAVNLANGEPVFKLLLSVSKRSTLVVVYGFLWLMSFSSEKKLKLSIHAASVKGSIFGLRGKRVNRYLGNQSEKGIGEED
jgi:glycosyltransferase involved in cell wall biosynthesis